MGAAAAGGVIASPSHQAAGSGFPPGGRGTGPGSPAASVRLIPAVATALARSCPVPVLSPAVRQAVALAVAAAPAPAFSLVLPVAVGKAAGLRVPPVRAVRRVRPVPAVPVCRPVVAVALLLTVLCPLPCPVPTALSGLMACRLIVHDVSPLSFGICFIMRGEKAVRHDPLVRKGRRGPAPGLRPCCSCRTRSGARLALRLLSGRDPSPGLDRTAAAAFQRLRPPCRWRVCGPFREGGPGPEHLSVDGRAADIPQKHTADASVGASRRTHRAGAYGHDIGRSPAAAAARMLHGNIRRAGAAPPTPAGRHPEAGPATGHPRD